jgi:agmatinase
MPNRISEDAAGRSRVQMPAALKNLPWELPHRFLGLDDEASDFELARAVVLPVPYESTTSFGAGPRAILEASRYVELFDQELSIEPATVGVHTLPALELTRDGASKAMAELEQYYGQIVNTIGERFLIMLGGEHSISSPAIRAWAKRRERRLSVLQLDAHADLRAQYEGSAHSHASAMARVLDVADIVAVGVRGVSTEEVQAARNSGASTLIWADEMWENDAWMDRAMAGLGEEVYLTFDVDYFDPSLVPSTGTPEPGGGDWYRTLRFLRRVFRERKVIACDVVEFAPIPAIHAPDALVAKLVYKLLGYRFEGRW